MHIPLKSLKILALDFQTTGNNPKNSHLLEMGWCQCDAMDTPLADSSTTTTFVVRQPHQATLSKRIQKLTGIENDHMSNAVTVHNAMDALYRKAAEVARANRAASCPLVIHYARFEAGFLIHLHEKRQPGAQLPFEVICTHQIVQRLMPQLPRKGIRAVAGYLGHSVPAAKRCAHHLAATAHIWRYLVQRLESHADVRTLGQLRHWLKHTPVPSKAKRYPMSREKRLGIPDAPGIYRMLRSNGDVLYIGKATSLKQRINSYFQKKRHSESTLEMLTQAVGLNITVTSSALEAALNESDAIKAYHPPYNTALVDRHRQLFYISRDFAVQSAEMDAKCVLGPVASTKPFIACHALGLHLSGQVRQPLDIPRMMAMPQDRVPEEATFIAGLALFREKYRTALDRMEMGNTILHIGRRSWMEKLALKAVADPPDTDRTPAEDQTPFEWTPDAVASNLESLCRHCGFMLRRSRWFALLSESVVVWRPGNDTRKGLNTMVMHRGDVARHYIRDQRAPIPKPPGAGVRIGERRRRIDLMRFDRLRVLTTEMRRLTSENRLECVQLGEKACLYPRQLRQLFNWV